jgi:hypothetical protein
LTARKEPIVRVSRRSWRGWRAHDDNDRLLGRQYEAQRDSLRDTTKWLGVEHPEWPRLPTAWSLIEAADELMRFNRFLRDRGHDADRLARDEGWILDVRAAAREVAGDDGGAAGVREPRRPLPRSG